MPVQDFSRPFPRVFRLGLSTNRCKFFDIALGDAHERMLFLSLTSSDVSRDDRIAMPAFDLIFPMGAFNGRTAHDVRRECIRRYRTLFLIAACCFSLLYPSIGRATDLSQLEEIIDESRLTLARFVGNPNMAWFRDRARHATAVFIAPRISKAGYIFGASWGTGVLLVRNSSTGGWNQPMFYRVTGLSFGLQFGALHSEIVALATDDREADEMVDGAFNLGISGAFGAGRYGGGLSGSLDVSSGSGVLIVSSPTGFFAGVAAGATIALARDAANELYYGHPVGTEELRQNSIHQWYSDRLVKTLNDLSATDEEVRR